MNKGQRWRLFWAHAALLGFIALMLVPLLMVVSISLRAGNFATGDKLVRRATDLCTVSSIRFLTFPFAGSGTRLGIWIANPRGVGPGPGEPDRGARGLRGRAVRADRDRPMVRRGRFLGA